ncbi:MAG TPA: STAS domain-containing protein [Acidimicrobiales bacterium]|nr:STAS domain-containing protein [Acidimicrobiales bacterium]
MADAFSLALGGLEVRCGAPLEGSTIVELRGELDSVSVPVLREVLDRLYAQGTYRIRVDLRELGFIDSSGLGALVGAWRSCSANDGSVEVLNPTPTVRQLLEMTGINRFLLPGG